ncbi:hypothetical protein [Oceanobacillus picturae]|uniref:hypothetical protein n=1 Tax=Oceanobacillus picturae TaxID=171693 RepID=UPI00362B79E8
MNLKGEKGAVLVLTLLMVTLIILFITALTGQVIQTTKQVTTMEKRIDAELVLQMGIDYVQAVLDAYEYNEEQDAMEYLEEKLGEHLQTVDNGNTQLKLDDERKFEINLPDPLPAVKEGEDIEVTYTIIGIAQGQTAETKDKIKITFTEDE